VSHKILHGIEMLRSRPRAHRDLPLHNQTKTEKNEVKSGRFSYSLRNRLVQGALLSFSAVLFLFYISNHKELSSNPRALANTLSSVQKDFDQELVSKSAYARNLDGLPKDSIYRLSVINIHGVLEPLAKYAGMLTLIVNVASE